VVKSKDGFTLIELIFAIVVISIVVVSLPMMMQTTTKTIDNNLVQEAIFGASAQLNGAITAHWDENSMQDDKDGLARVIDVNDTSCTNHRRKGHIAQPLHRRCLDDSSTDPLDDAQDDEIFALEDMQTNDEELFDNNSSAQGYKKSYKYTISVQRDVDFNGTNEDMKEIDINITDENGNLITVLKTYSANIGEVDFYKRRY